MDQREFQNAQDKVKKLEQDFLISERVFKDKYNELKTKYGFSSVEDIEDELDLAEDELKNLTLENDELFDELNKAINQYESNTNG